jgi:hypothetical protein
MLWLAYWLILNENTVLHSVFRGHENTVLDGVLERSCSESEVRSEPSLPLTPDF